MQSQLCAPYSRSNACPLGSPDRRCGAGLHPISRLHRAGFTGSMPWCGLTGRLTINHNCGLLCIFACEPQDPAGLPFQSNPSCSLRIRPEKRRLRRALLPFQCVVGLYWIHPTASTRHHNCGLHSTSTNAPAFCFLAHPVTAAISA